MNIGVALPEWVFAQDRRTAPLVLLALVFAGLALPILGIALYLHRAQGKVGANQVRTSSCHSLSLSQLHHIYSSQLQLSTYLYTHCHSCC